VTMAEILVVFVIVGAAAALLGRRALRTMRAEPPKAGALPPACTGCAQSCGGKQC